MLKSPTATIHVFWILSFAFSLTFAHNIIDFILWYSFESPVSIYGLTMPAVWTFPTKFVVAVEIIHSLSCWIRWKYSPLFCDVLAMTRAKCGQRRCYSNNKNVYYISTCSLKMKTTGIINDSWFLNWYNLRVRNALELKGEFLGILKSK